MAIYKRILYNFTTFFFCKSCELRYLSLVVLQGNFNGWKSWHTIWWLYASFVIKGVVIWRGSTVYSVVYLFCKNGFPRAILHWRWSHGCEMWHQCIFLIKHVYLGFSHWCQWRQYNLPKLHTEINNNNKFLSRD